MTRLGHDKRLGVSRKGWEVTKVSRGGSKIRQKMGWGLIGQNSWGIWRQKKQRFGVSKAIKGMGSKKAKLGWGVTKFPHPVIFYRISPFTGVQLCISIL